MAVRIRVRPVRGGIRSDRSFHSTYSSQRSSWALMRPICFVESLVPSVESSPIEKSISYVRGSWRLHYGFKPGGLRRKAPRVRLKPCQNMGYLQRVIISSLSSWSPWSKKGTNNISLPALQSEVRKEAGLTRSRCRSWTSFTLSCCCYGSGFTAAEGWIDKLAKRNPPH